MPTYEPGQGPLPLPPLPISPNQTGNMPVALNPQLHTPIAPGPVGAQSASVANSGVGVLPPVMPPNGPPLTPITGATPTIPGVTPQAPIVVAPIDDCMRSVTVTGITQIHFKPIIQIFVNGVLRGSRLLVPIPIAGPTSVEVAISGCSLNAGDLVQASSMIGTVSSPLSDAVRVESHVLYSCLTQHYDNARTGWYPYERQLTPDVLQQPGANAFQQQFQLPVDGKAYAQPLYMHHVNFPGFGARNVVYIATENNSVFAYDADDPGSILLWQRSLVPAGQRTPTSGDSGNVDIPCGDIQPTVGVSSTPVISCGCVNACGGSGCGCSNQCGDTNSCCAPTMYVTSKTIGINDGTAGMNNNGSFHWYLHALDVITGLERPGSPVEICGKVNGRALINDGQGHVLFNPERQNNRCSLLLLNGCVYIAFASHCDNEPYQGWVFAYDAVTLKQKAIFCTCPNFVNGGESGIWQGGFGLATDGDAIYCTTGNGPPGADITKGTGKANGGDSYYNSVLKLSQNLQVLSWFTPADQLVLSNNDVDLGSGGVMVIPGMQLGFHPNQVVTCGKDGNIMLLDRDNLGGFGGPSEPWNQQTAATFAQYPGFNNNAISTTLLQPTAPLSNQNAPNSFSPNQPGVWGGPAYFNGVNGQFIFYAGNDTGNAGHLTSFALRGGSMNLLCQSKESFGGLGSTPVVSSGSFTTSNGILWAVKRDGAGGNVNLCAYDLDQFTSTPTATSIIGPSTSGLPIGIWNDTRPFIEPTIVNGKVYVAAEDHIGVFFCANEIKVP